MTFLRRFPAARRAAAAALVLAGAGCAPVGPQVPVYVVFFTPYSSVLDEPAKVVVADAAKAALTVPGRRVLVEGYADLATTPEASRVVSRQRAEAVAAEIAAQGVPQSRIVLQPKGHVGGDPGVESRRVEIEIP